MMGFQNNFSNSNNKSIGLISQPFMPDFDGPLKISKADDKSEIMRQMFTG